MGLPAWVRIPSLSLHSNHHKRSESENIFCHLHRTIFTFLGKPGDVQIPTGVARFVLPLRLLKHGEVAEWSKAAALGAALFGGVGSNPILVNQSKDSGNGIQTFHETFFSIVCRPSEMGVCRPSETVRDGCVPTVRDGVTFEWFQHDQNFCR